MNIPLNLQFSNQLLLCYSCRYVYTMKTVFDLDFYIFQTFKQHEYGNRQKSPWKKVLKFHNKKVLWKKVSGNKVLPI